MPTIGLFTKAKQDPLLDQAPFQRILAAVMRGNAQVQGESQAKEVVSKQMAESAKTSVTLNPDGTTTIKNAPTSLLNHAQNQEVTDAANGPHVAVESKIAEMNPQPTPAMTDAEPVYKIVDKTVGYRVPRPSDPDITEKLKTPEGIRSLTVEMGGRPQDADAAMKALKSGRVTVAGMRERVAAFRAKKLDALYSTVEKPLNEAQDIETKRTAANKEDTERLDKIVKETDFVNTPPEKWIDSVESDYGKPLTDDTRNRITKRATASVNAKINSEFTDFRKDPAVGSYETLDDARRAFGHYDMLEPSRKSQFDQDYAAAHRTYLQKDTKERAQIDALRIKKEGDTTAVTAIADAIESGDQPPDLSRMYKLAGPVRAELAKRGFPLAKASLDWQATQQHVKTLNGPQQTRLRQAVDASYNQLDVVDGLYDEWKREGAVSGVKIFNKAALATAKNLPGKAGAAAQALEGQIALLTGELGNTLMGGNSPTDHALSLAQSMLSGTWNEETFKKAIKQLRIDLGIRKNSLASSSPAGASADNPYDNTPKGGTSGPVITDEKTILDIFKPKGKQ